LLSTYALHFYNSGYDFEAFCVLEAISTINKYCLEFYGKKLTGLYFSILHNLFLKSDMFFSALCCVYQMEYFKIPYSLNKEYDFTLLKKLSKVKNEGRIHENLFCNLKLEDVKEVDNLEYASKDIVNYLEKEKYQNLNLESFHLCNINNPENWNFLINNQKKKLLKTEINNNMINFFSFNNFVINEDEYKISIDEYKPVSIISDINDMVCELKKLNRKEEPVVTRRSVLIIDEIKPTNEIKVKKKVVKDYFTENYNIFRAKMKKRKVFIPEEVILSLDKRKEKQRKFYINFFQKNKENLIFYKKNEKIIKDCIKELNKKIKEERETALIEVKETNTRTWTRKTNKTTIYSPFSIKNDINNYTINEGPWKRKVETKSETQTSTYQIKSFTKTYDPIKKKVDYNKPWKRQTKKAEPQNYNPFANKNTEFKNTEFKRKGLFRTEEKNETTEINSKVNQFSFSRRK